ncbi:MAG: glycosyltransferase family 2 protein [Desulfobacteraceae bacterium]|nr:glycosyltransferase family 2 protein [Desulfobacteraceae bacterium]
MKKRLVVISPSRDESNYIRITLESMIAQTRPPDRWIIVDDGSRDGTGDIVREYASKYPWIELARRERSGARQLGPGVVSAFRFGLSAVEGDPYDVIAKMDCDIEFAPTTLETIMARFEDSCVGMASGIGYLKIGSSMIPERYPRYHCPGMAKFYRRACFEQIGGPQPLYGWDILDETDARRHGWTTLSDPGAVFIHHRVQSSTLGNFRGRITWGQGAYAVGTHPLFAVIRGFYRMLEPPWIIGGMAFLYGFFSSYLNAGINRTRDPELIRHIRGEQIYRLFHANRLPQAGGGPCSRK